MRPRLVRPTNLMSRMNGKKTHTHTHSIQGESGKNTRKNDISKKKKKKKSVAIGTPAYRRTIEWKGRGFINEGIETKNEAKQNKRYTREKTPWHLQTKPPEDTSLRHLWIVNKGERTSTSPLALGYPLYGSSRHVRAYHCML